MMYRLSLLHHNIIVSRYVCPSCKLSRQAVFDTHIGTGDHVPRLYFSFIRQTNDIANVAFTRILLTLLSAPVGYCQTVFFFFFYQKFDTISATMPLADIVCRYDGCGGLAGVATVTKGPGLSRGSINISCSCIINCFVWRNVCRWCCVHKYSRSLSYNPHRERGERR